MIPYARQNISDLDIEAVIAVLKSDFLTQGPKVLEFEKAIANYSGAKFAVAVSNATSALHIACLAAGLTSQDTLWTSPISFVASANCGLYCGAKVKFCDIHPKTYNLDPEVLETKLREAAAASDLPKIVIPVHLAGQSCDMKKISELAKKYSLTIIEDASHAIGGSYRNKKIGNCEFSDMTVFSFHPVKIITTGEGGVITTNNPQLYEKLISLRSHGITRAQDKLERNDGPWYYEQQGMGFNYRLTDIQAALGLSQLTRLDTFVERRNELADMYGRLLNKLPLTLPEIDADCVSAFHLYIVCLDRSRTDMNHREIFEKLRAAEIGVNLHYIPIYRQPYYSRMGYRIQDFPIAEQYYSTAISLPMFFDLSANDQEYVAETLKTILSRN